MQSNDHIQSGQNDDGIGTKNVQNNSASHQIEPIIQKGDKIEMKHNLDDFKITRIIGEGHQGKVVQATYRKTGQVFALKIIPTKLIKEQK